MACLGAGAGLAAKADAGADKTTEAIAASSTTHYLLLASLLTTHYLLLIIQYSLLTSHFCLLTTYDVLKPTLAIAVYSLLTLTPYYLLVY